MDFTQANYSKIFDKHLPKCVSLSRYLDITHLRWVILVFTRGNHIKFNYFFSSRAFSSFLAVEWSWLRRGLALFPPLVMSSSLWIIFSPSSMTGRWQVEHAVHSNRVHSRVEWFLKKKKMDRCHIVTNCFGPQFQNFTFSCFRASEHFDCYLKISKKSFLSRVRAECFREISLKLQEFEEHFELLFFQ